MSGLKEDAEKNIVRTMFFTYILASRRNGTLYTGSTDDLVNRVADHREGIRPGFTAKYRVTRLVWFETHLSRDAAFRRERQIKEWRRVWKLQLIEARNPTWRDLYDEVRGPSPEALGALWLAEKGLTQPTR
jgi:putative endonuclease